MGQRNNTALSKCIIEAFVSNKTSNKSHGFCTSQNQAFDMLVLTDQKLRFFNTFRFNTKEDFIYFLLFAMEQQHLNPERTPVQFSGAIEAGSEIHAICERYIRHIQFENV